MRKYRPFQEKNLPNLVKMLKAPADTTIGRRSMKGFGQTMWGRCFAFYCSSRIKISAHSARDAVPPGERRFAVRPVSRPSATAHAIASRA